MRRVANLAFCFLLPLTASTQAQSSDQLQRDLRTQILKQRLILQSFSADPVTFFEWTAKGLLNTPPKVRTLGVFKLSSAKLDKDTLVLTGSRSTIYKEKDAKPVLLGDAPIVIKIALNGADPTQVFPKLKQELFFPTLQSAIAAIPPQDQQTIYPTGEHSTQSCPTAGAHYIRPKVVHSEAADFSEEARRAHFNGSVTVSITVDENGNPSDLWLKKPSGFGLDEQAIKAVSDYRFKPATCDGTAVKTSLTIDVNFTIQNR